MKKLLKVLVILTVFVAIALVAGLYAPLDTSTVSYGNCSTEPAKKVELHYVKGQSLKDVEDQVMVDQNDCRPDVKYTLYFF